VADDRTEGRSRFPAEGENHFGKIPRIDPDLIERLDVGCSSTGELLPLQHDDIATGRVAFHLKRTASSLLERNQRRAAAAEEVEHVLSHSGERNIGRSPRVQCILLSFSCLAEAAFDFPLAVAEGLVQDRRRGAEVAEKPPRIARNPHAVRGAAPPRGGRVARTA